MTQPTPDVILPRRILGAVLAGGRASRFGSDKALALLDGKPLIGHAVAGLRRHAQAVVVCGREWPYMTCLADRPEPGQGPLGGLNAALHHARLHGFDAVITTGCDMPDFPDAAAQALLDGAGAAILDRHHLAALWPADLADRLDRHMADTPDRSLFGWIARVRPRVVTLPGIVMPNINHVGELDALAHARRARNT